MLAPRGATSDRTYGLAPRRRSSAISRRRFIPAGAEMNQREPDDDSAGVGDDSVVSLMHSHLFQAHSLRGPQTSHSYRPRRVSGHRKRLRDEGVTKTIISCRRARDPLPPVRPGADGALASARAPGDRFGRGVHSGATAAALPGRRWPAFGPPDRTRRPGDHKAVPVPWAHPVHGMWPEDGGQPAGAWHVLPLSGALSPPARRSWPSTRQRSTSEKSRYVTRSTAGSATSSPRNTSTRRCAPWSSRRTRPHGPVVIVTEHASGWLTPRLG